MEKANIQNITDLIGQKNNVENLLIQISAAKQRRDYLDHILFCGETGSGKSTFARAVAFEMGKNYRALYGNSIKRVGDFAAVLTSLKDGEILLIENIELLHKPIVEILYPVLEDFLLDVVIGKGSLSRSVRIKLNHFTIIGTASNSSIVDVRLKRNMYSYEFVPYKLKELGEIIKLIAKENVISVEHDAVNLIAKSVKCLPSEAAKLLKYSHSYAIARADGVVTVDVVNKALALRANY